LFTPFEPQGTPPSTFFKKFPFFIYIQRFRFPTSPLSRGILFLFSTRTPEGNILLPSPALSFTVPSQLLSDATRDPLLIRSHGSVPRRLSEFWFPQALLQYFTPVMERFFSEGFSLIPPHPHTTLSYRQQRALARLLLAVVLAFPKIGFPPQFFETWFHPPLNRLALCWAHTPTSLCTIPRQWVFLPILSPPPFFPNSVVCFPLLSISLLVARPPFLLLGTGFGGFPYSTCQDPVSFFPQKLSKTRIVSFPLAKAKNTPQLFFSRQSKIFLCGSGLFCCCSTCPKTRTPSSSFLV